MKKEQPKHLKVEHIGEKVCGNCKQPYRGEAYCPHSPQVEEWSDLKFIIENSENTKDVLDAVNQLILQARADERREMVEKIEKLTKEHKTYAETDDEETRIEELGDELKNLIKEK